LGGDPDISANDRMVITTSGNVGIGTTTPTGLFQVGGGSLTVLANGNVGIGTVTPQHKLDVNGAMYSRRYAASTTIDFNNGNVQSLTLASGANVVTFANGQDGGKYILMIKQPPSGGAGTISWPATVRWGNGTAPVFTTTNAKTDYIGFIYNGVDTKYDGVATMYNMN
jgi:hypothetical protein